MTAELLLYRFVNRRKFRSPESFQSEGAPLKKPTVAHFTAIGDARFQMSKRFYITTAIDYVNGHPHLGHAYEKIIADVIARAQRALDQETFYLTGLDEHGQKVQQSADAAGQPVQEYCDELAKSWLKFVTGLRLSNNDFVRTSQDRHQRVVQAVLDKLYRNGHFYQAEYHGWYSTRQETFLSDRDRREDGTFDPIYGEVIELTENNYYFKLGEHQQWLIDFIEANPEFIAPDYRRNEILGFLKNNVLEDLCVTRPRNRLSWGIPLPFDPEYVTYVWFDALINYITVPAALGDPVVCEALGLTPETPGGSTEFWPADIHVIGKDIIKFHAVYWPVMLNTLGLPLPKQILAHGFWQKEGAKIAKSTGNIVDPAEVIAEWGLDAFRYYVTRELDIGPDGNWTDAGFEARYSAELANGLGNLVNRSLSMLNRYREGVVPDRDDELKNDAEACVTGVRNHLSANRLQTALQTIWGFIARVNQYVDHTAPFKLAKQENQQKRLDEVLYNLVESVRVIGTLLAPFLPTSAERVSEQLNLSGEAGGLNTLAWGGLQPGHRVNQPSPLFPRKDLQKTA